MMNNETETEIFITNEYLKMRREQMHPGDETISKYAKGKQDGKDIYYVDDAGVKTQIVEMNNIMNANGVMTTIFTDMDGKAFNPTF